MTPVDRGRLAYPEGNCARPFDQRMLSGFVSLPVSFLHRSSHVQTYPWAARHWRSSTIPTARVFAVGLWCREWHRKTSRSIPWRLIVGHA